MLPNLGVLLSLNAVSLGGPLARTEDSLVDIVLKEDGVVKGALGREGGPCRPGAVPRIRRA
jgi:hypothetical protein